MHESLMPIDESRRFIPVNIAVLTVSDTRDLSTDRSGDTLASIARRHGTPVSAIAAANGIANPNLIVVGRSLQVAGSPAPAGTSGCARRSSARPSGRVSSSPGRPVTSSRSWWTTPAA